MAKKKGVKEKKVPERTCIACRNKAAKGDMVRVVRMEDGTAVIDESGKIRGRGANLCESMDCFNKATRIGAIERSLELGKKLNEEEVEKLQKDFQEVLYKREFRKGKKTVTLRITKDDLIDALTK